MTRIKNIIPEIFISSSTLGIILYSNDPIIYKDSLRYIGNSLFDPPIYSTLIFIMQSIFGSLNSVIVFQSLLLGMGIFYFNKTIATQFNLDVLSKIITLTILFIPILKFYRILLPESLGYAFTLLFISFVIKLIYNFNYQNLIYTSLFGLTLLLLRHQFFFIYPVIIFTFMGIFILNKSKKTLILLFCSLFFILITQNILVSFNSHLKKPLPINQDKTHEFLGPYYFTYIDAMYISSVEDVELFEDDNIKKTLIKIYNILDDQKAYGKYYDSRGHYALSLGKINSISQKYMETLAEVQNTDVKSLKKHISIKLLKKNFTKYIKHIFKKFYDATWIFVFIPFVMLISSLIVFFKKKSQLALSIIFLSFFTCCNHAIIYLFGRIQPRYMIYSDFIVLAFIFIIFLLFLQNKNKIYNK